MATDPVTEEVRRIKVKKEAQRVLAAEKREGLRLSGEKMTSWIEEPDTPIDWRIEGLHEIGDNTTLAAAYKTGKSTMLLNLVRSLADGSPFLGDRKVKPVSGTVYYWNLEIGERRIKRWLRRLEIVHHELVIPENLRGRRIPLVDEDFRDELIEHLKRIECEVWIIDPLGRITSSWPGYNGRENNNDTMREVCEVLDEIKTKAGIEDLIIATHTGRQGEHTRGATVFDDWPDVLLHMTKRKEDDEGFARRYFWAEGRDVEQEEVPLGYDPETNSVWIEANLKSIKSVGHARKVVKTLLMSGKGMNATTLRDSIVGIDKNQRNAARDDAVSKGWVNVETVRGRGQLYTANLDDPEVQKMSVQLKGEQV